MFAVGLPALALGLACGLFYAAADGFRKATPEICPPATILFYYIGGQIPVLAAWVVWNGETLVDTRYALPGLADAVIGLCANLLFLLAIRRSALSLMIPLLALVPVMTLLIGGAVLGEWPTQRQVAGMGLVAAGLFAVFQPTAGRPGLGAALKSFRAEAGTPPMLAVVLLWSVTPALDKICLAYTSAAMHGLIQVSVIWTALAVWGFARKPTPFRAPREAVPPVTAAAIAGAIGYACQLLAYSMTMVSVVEVLKRTVGLLGSLFVGRAAFREPLTAMKIAGISIVAVGVPLIILA